MFVHDRRSFLRSTILGAGAAFIATPALAASALCQRPVSGQKIYPVNPQCLAVPNGLVGYWPLGADTTDFNQGLTFDISGKGNTGTLTGLTAASLTQGPMGTGLTFNGSSSIVQTPSISYPFSTAFSVCVWFVITGGSGVRSVWRASSSGVGIYIVANGAIAMLAGSFVNGSTGVFNTKYFVCLVSNGSSWLLYINGSLSASTSTSISNISSAAGIGGDAFSQYFTGSISSIANYTKSLSPLEIQTLYRAGLAGQRTPWPNYGDVEPINLNRRDIFRRIAA